MTWADGIVLGLAIVNLAGIVFSMLQVRRADARALRLVQERAALEVLLRDEFRCDIRFRHEGDILHLDCRHSDRLRHADIPFTVN
jgi:hypothetical protein